MDIGPPCSVNQRNKDLVNDAHTIYSCSNETNKLSHSVNKLYSDEIRTTKQDIAFLNLSKKFVPPVLYANYMVRIFIAIC